MSNLQYTNLPSDTASEDILEQLALDVNWTLSRAADTLWRRLNAELWERTHNPWAVLQTVSGRDLKRITAEPSFRASLDEIVRTRSAENELPRWFQQTHPHSPLTSVAYFSMEYMLSEALPIYSGGLGNVAGDQLKSASDLLLIRLTQQDPTYWRLMSLAPRICSYSVDFRPVPRPRRVWNPAAGVLRRLCRKTNSSR